MLESFADMMESFVNTVPTTREQKQILVLFLLFVERREKQIRANTRGRYWQWPAQRKEEKT